MSFTKKTWFNKGETGYENPKLNADNLNDLENSTLVHHVNQALRAHGIMKKHIDYIVKVGEVLIVDEFTGRIMYGRRYNNGLHQAIEAKEHVKIADESKTLATITFLNYFRMYNKLSGMTGTAMTEEAEFEEIYNLDVVEIPTNKPMIRKDENDVIYKNENAKFRAIVKSIKESHEKGHYAQSLEWAKGYDQELVQMLVSIEYSLKVLGIERGNTKPRKDISKWSDVKNAIFYMYDDKFFAQDIHYEYDKIQDKEEIKKILSTYLEKYFNINDDKQTWFDKIKDLAEKLGYAREVKMYKQEPEKWSGHVGDISTVIRVSLTGRKNTPDLYEIMQVLGEDSIKRRINKLIA